MKQSLTAAAVAICFLFLGNIAKADTTLRMHFKKGDVIHYDVKLEINDSIAQEGDLTLPIPRPFTVTAVGTATLEVLDFNEYGVATVRMSAPDLNVTVNGKSTKDAAAEGDVTGLAVAQMLVNGFEIDVDEKNSILMKSFEPFPPGLDMDSIRQLMIAPALEFPDDPVKDGGTWHKDAFVALPYFDDSIVVGIDHTVKGAATAGGGKLATVTTKASFGGTDLKVNFSDVSIPGMDTKDLNLVVNGMNAKLDMTRSIDLATGYMTALNVKMDADIDAHGENGAGAATDISGALNMSLLLTESTAAPK